MESNSKTSFSAFLESLPDSPRLRLAPTPSGFLHIGNALNFWLNWRCARSRLGGKVLLRIDDLDADRKRPEYVEDIFRTLDWLKIDWDEGPSGPDDFEKNWSQACRRDLYEDMLTRLRRDDALFACGKSRKELAAFGDNYPETFRRQNIAHDTPEVAWRVKTPPGFAMHDFVVRRRDGVPAYQIASLADDVHFNITHIVRGEDLRASSAAQVFLAEKLGLSGFLNTKIWHHPLLLDCLGNKLSKSAGASALREMQKREVEQVLGEIARAAERF